MNAPPDTPRFAPLPPDCRSAGLAVSGGADSVALLHLALEHAAGARLAVLHFDHRIPGIDGAADAAFVQRLARAAGLPFMTAANPSPGAPKGHSPEMAARAARLAFFARAAAELKLDAILTAHHADDVAETLLLRLARGSGAQGLSGLRPESRVGPVRFLRPLLGCTRESLRRYLAERNLSWREDPTNTDLAIPRNALRHTLLPRLDPAGLQRSAAILREEDAFLADLADSHWPQALRPDASLDLASLPLPLRRRLLLRWLRDEIRVEPGFDAIERLLAMPDGILTLAPRRRVRKTGAAFHIIAPPPSPAPLEVPVAAPGDYAFGPFRITCRLFTGIHREPPAFGRFPISASVAPGPLLARTRRPGDRISPIGLDGSRKIKDVFTDAKVPDALRRRLPVFERAGAVIWLPGYRIAASAALPGPSAAAWLLTVDC